MPVTVLNTGGPKLYGVLASLSEIELKTGYYLLIHQRSKYFFLFFHETYSVTISRAASFRQSYEKVSGYFFVFHTISSCKTYYSVCKQLQKPCFFFCFFTRLNIKWKIKHTWFIYFPFLLTTFTYNSCKKWFQDQNLPTAIWNDENKIMSVGHIDVCYITWQCMKYTYWCTHSKHGGILRAEMKITEKVKMQKNQLNTFLYMENRGDPLL